MKIYTIEVVEVRELTEIYEVEAEDEEEAEMKYAACEAMHIPEYDKGELLSINIHTKEK